MTVNQEVKGTLAKLLATENLHVEHRNVPTAYFEVDRRVLCLPIWKNVSGTVYDLLVGHEVGHALYTPTEYGEVDIPKDFLNVVEDARVEKLMKRRYPGLTRSFFKGYTELYDSDFFEVKEKELGKLSLIDRVNLHFKIGGVGCVVPINRDEMAVVNQIANAETFDDAVDAAIALYELSKEKQQEKVEEEQQPTQGGGDTTQEESDSTQGQSEGQSEVSDTNEEKQQGSATFEGSTGVETSSDTGGVDEMESITENAWNKNQELLVDENAKEYFYMDVPNFNLQDTIVSYSKIYNHLNEHYSEVSNQRPGRNEEVLKMFAKYKKESIKTVNYLVKEFECKKAANNYRRSNTSKTGILNTQKLHTYKWSEDLFKKVTTIPDGKNHGLVFFLDWSGSMSNVMHKTMKQLFDLVWFCKKVSIPFRVYAFSDNSWNTDLFPGCPAKNDEKHIWTEQDFRLLELLSSKMSTQILDKQMRNLWCQSYYFLNDGIYDSRYHLCGTPLVETILSTPQVVEHFQKNEKIEKVNVVYLTDGEAAQPSCCHYSKGLGGVTHWPMYNNRNYVLRDPKSRYSKVLDFYSDTVTTEFIEFIQNIVDYNILGFRLCGKSSAKEMIDAKEYVQFDKEWSKTKSYVIKNKGFDELYVLGISSNSYNWWNPEQEESAADIQGTTTGQLSKSFGKHMNGKMLNKVILSKFVGQIA